MLVIAFDVSRDTSLAVSGEAQSNVVLAALAVFLAAQRFGDHAF